MRTQVQAVVLMASIACLATASQAHQSATSSIPPGVPNVGRPLTTDELLAVRGSLGPDHPPVTVIADTVVHLDADRDEAACRRRRSTACVIGDLATTGGTAVPVSADETVRILYQRSGPTIEGVLAFEFDGGDLSFLGQVNAPQTGSSWPMTDAAMSVADTTVEAGQLVAVDGWLTVLGWGIPCPAPMPGIEGDPADSPFVRCPAGWIMAAPDLPDPGPAMAVLAPSSFGIEVQYGAYQAFAADPAQPVDFMAPPRQGTYLVRHVGLGMGPPTAWQVVGRLDPIDNPTSMNIQDPLTATDTGLSMAVTLDRTVVEPGGSVAVSVTIHNGRDVPVTLGDGCPATTDASVPMPQGRPGRTWHGLAGKFKRFVLTRGDAPGGAPALEPARIEARGRDCDVDAEALTLDPGASVTTSLAWRAAITEGIPAGPGDIPFEVSVLHDPSGAPPSRAPDQKGPIASWIRSYEELRVDGTLTVAGTAPGTVTAGEAIDALLADQRFADWLAERPSRTWSQANLFLETKDVAEGIVPVGASWEIELFRERGVPRDWAIGFVDASTGALRSVSFCDAPCDR